MKKYLKYLKNHYVAYLLILVIGFLSSFVTCYFINNVRAYYEASFIVENIESFDDSKLVDNDFLNEIKNSGANGKYEAIDVEKMLDKNHFSYTIQGNEITIKTKIKYYEDFFLSSSQSVGTRAKMFIKDSVLAIAKDNKVTFANSKDIVERHDYINRWFFALIGGVVVLISEVVASLFLYKKEEETEEEKCDNITVFSSCLHKAYWKEAAKPLKKVKDITTIAMLFALMLICKLISLPSGFGNLGISFTYLFFAIISMIYGPIYGAVVGMFSDIIGFFIDSNGGMFNLGYTLQASLTGFIYGLCLFKRKFTFKNALVSRVFVNMLINTIMGSFLFIFVMYFDPSMTGKEYMSLVKSYMTLLVLPKNVLYLLPQSLLLFVVIRTLLPILVRFNLVNKNIIVKRKQIVTK